jgi:acetyl esterase/lipase
MPTRRGLLASAALAPILAATNPVAAQEATPPAAQDDIEVLTDVAYGEADGQSLVLDVYRPPARETPRPAVILIHGGGWSAGVERWVNAEPAEQLAQAGYVAFNIEYRLMDGTPGHNLWPAQIDDVQRAVRWVRANAATYGVDPERIGSYGGSSGGQLSALLGVRDTRDNSDAELAGFSSRVTCVVDLSGDMDLAAPYPNPSDNELVATLLGGTPADAPEAYRDPSPLAWVDHDTVPFLIVHGGSDEVNPVELSRRMTTALHDAAVEVIYAGFPGVSHLGAFGVSTAPGRSPSSSGTCTPSDSRPASHVFGRLASAKNV